MRGVASLGRMLGLALLCTGLGTVTVASPEPAAALSGGPTAIGVGDTGTTWVGFADGGRLVRIAPDGKKRPAISLGTSEAVEGLVVTADNKVLVDLETRVMVLTGRGRVLEEFAREPIPTCGVDHPASRYGGITFGGGRAWVADRCTSTMSVYSRGGDLVATVQLPGAGHPRGIAYTNARSGRRAMVYVAMPDAGKVLAYRARSIRDRSEPARRVTIRRPAGGRKPQPSGLTVDRFGQLTVSDVANNALYLLDTTHGFSRYRTLGHPPRAGRAAGRLSGPTAIAQHRQDGGPLSGNLFIADTGNSRVQRWDTSGYTHWATKVSGAHRHRGGGCGGRDWSCRSLRSLPLPQPIRW